jgi:hypothetical protein
MDELVPVILGAILGAIVCVTTSGRTRNVLSAFAVLLSGATSTVATGEYQESLSYFLLDFGEAALGLVMGFVVAAKLLAPRTTRSAAERDGHAS